MSKIAIIEKVIDDCWECPHLLNGGVSNSEAIWLCTGGIRSVELHCLDDIPEWCPLDDEDDE